MFVLKAVYGIEYMMEAELGI